MRRRAGGGYWDATPFVATVLAEFDEALARRRPHDAEHRYEVLAAYARRTLGIIRWALDAGDGALARASLANFTVLHDAVGRMHDAAPRLVPVTAVLDRGARAHLLEDRIVEVLDGATRPLTVEQLARRLADGGRSAEGEARLIGPHVEALVASGHLRRAAGGTLARTGRRHVGVAPGGGALELLVGPVVRPRLWALGVHTVGDVADVADGSPGSGDRSGLAAALGVDEDTAATFAAVAARLTDEWRHALVRPQWPASTARGYQRRAHALLRAARYGGVVLDAPAGSGKTMIGAMCIVDWLDRLAAGRTVLVLVPSVAIQRQWVHELCAAPAGPLLAPHLVTAATTATLRERIRRGHGDAAVVVLTYAAMAGVASAGGTLDREAVERELRRLEVRHVLLDEAHVAAERPGSLTAGVVAVCTQRLRLGLLDGVVGLSATAQPFADRLAALGLRVERVVEDVELVAEGYLAPFAEAAVVFGRSDRERSLHTVAAGYRAELRRRLGRIGGTYLRAWFAAVPMEQRLAIGKHLLRLSARGPDHDAALAERFIRWEHGGALRMAELPLVAIVQIANGWSDRDLEAAAANMPDVAMPIGMMPDPTGPTEGSDVLARWRDAAAALVVSERDRRRLTGPGFGERLDGERLRALAAAGGAGVNERRHEARDLLATTAVGAYLTVRDALADRGEGRVHAVAAVIAAEHDCRRPVRTLVFERGGGPVAEDGVVTAGWRGAAGTFAALVGGPHTTVAVLPDALYLPARSPSMAASAAGFVRAVVVGEELADRLVELVVAGLWIDDDDRHRLAIATREALADLLRDDPAGGPGGSIGYTAIERTVLRPLRHLVAGWARRPSVPAAARLAVAERLGTRSPSVRVWAAEVVDHLGLAIAFDRAEPVRLRAPGAVHPVELVRLPGGARRRTAQEVVARLIDGAAGVEPVDTVVVTSWARGGWNVVTPDVLIDATATRDPVAWQQLRGRVLRPAVAGEVVSPAVAGEVVSPAVAGEVGTTAAPKVAHVYELLRGDGADPQVERGPAGWERVASLAAKHRHELAVDLASGHMSRDASHAGIVDGGAERPEALRAALRTVLAGADERVTRAWAAAAAVAPPDLTGAGQAG